MPEIASVTPLVSAAPTAPASPVASIGPTADGSAQDFLGQLKAALKTLAGVVNGSASPLVPQPVTVDATGTAPVVTADPGTPAKVTDPQPADVLPELLAAMGAVLVPVPQTPLPSPVDAATNATAPTPQPVAQPPVSSASVAPQVAQTPTATELQPGPVPATEAVGAAPHASTLPTTPLQTSPSVAVESHATPPSRCRENVHGPLQLYIVHLL